MTLIKCKECSKEFSDNIGTCPWCGNTSRNQNIEYQKPIEIELTNKKWKKMHLFSLFIAILALLTFSISITGGFLLLFLALIIGWIASVGAWWSNG